MSLVLCIHNTYNAVESALARDNQILACMSVAKELASAQLIPAIEGLLTVQQVLLADISSIIINQGPAPFTTLRTSIVTANGLAFARKIPLIGVDALDAFMSEYDLLDGSSCIVLLNAFNKAVYYGYKNSLQQSIKGYASINSCLQTIKAECTDRPVKFLGNGTQMYRSEIEAVFAENVIIPDPLPLTASLQYILKIGVDRLHKGEGISQFIEPLYLKKPL